MPCTKKKKAKTWREANYGTELGTQKFQTIKTMHKTSGQSADKKHILNANKFWEIYFKIYQ